MTVRVTVLTEANVAVELARISLEERVLATSWRFAFRTRRGWWAPGWKTNERMPDADSSDLFRLYAILLRAKGANVTQSDVHDAWSAWMAMREGEHTSLVPYDELP